MAMSSIASVFPASPDATPSPDGTPYRHGPQVFDNGAGPTPSISNGGRNLNSKANATTSASPSEGAANGNSLNPRSCTTCRKRKVRCDKRHPCSNCNKQGIECVFPGPGRAPRRSRKPPDAELLARLRRLEGVVQSMGKGVDEQGEIEENGIEAEEKGGAEVKMEGPCPTSNGGGIFGHMSPSPTAEDGKEDKIVKEFGRLVVEEGRSRYVSNKFWTSLGDEVAEMRDLLEDPTDDEEDYPSPGSGSSASANHQGFIFSFSSTILSLRNFHPPTEQIYTYYNIFKENVDPLVKVFHKPSLEKMIAEARQNMDGLSKANEVVLFSLYFAAATSLSADDSIIMLGLERQAAMKKYRFAFEQALSRAGFLSTTEMVVLQSFALFLACVRRHDDTRYVWTLTGLLIRLAHALGIHRDGQQFGVSPFATEMRRRLWWQITTLDVRSAEDHGIDPSIVEQTFDTKFPLNINDADIDPGSETYPPEREGFTEMTFDLARYSVSTTVRRLSYAPPGPGPCRVKNAALTIEDKEKLIEELHQYLETKYLKFCDMSIPFHWVVATIARLIMAKMWLIVHQPFTREDRTELSKETKDRLFLTSIELIEFSHLLETEKTTLKWGWLFRTYVQWQALVFLLSQLCSRTTGPEVDKAWSVIDSVFDEWGGVVASTRRGMLWKPIRRLMTKAKSERARALERQASFPLDGSLGPAMSTVMKSEPSSSLPTNESNDFPGFDPSLSMSSDPLLQQPVGPGSMQTMQTEPFVPMNTTPADANSTEQWVMDDSGLAQDPFGADGTVNWAGWDDLVKDFQMEIQDGQGFERGPVIDGMTNWW